MSIDFFKISKFFLYLVPLCVVVVSTATLFPFIVGKYVWFRTAIDLAFIFFLLGLLLLQEEAKEHENRLRKIFSSPLTIIISLFVLFFILAGFFGIDPSASFWSNFERGEGGLQILHLYVFFLLLCTLFKRENWLTLFRVSLFAAVFLILYGIAATALIGGFVGTFHDQGGKLIADSFLGRLNVARFQGSLGNPAYVGVYLIFIMFYALYLFTETKARWRKNFLVALLIFYFLFFWLAQTRGVFLGLFAAIFAGVVYFIFSSRGRLKKWGIGILAFFVAVTSILFYFRDTSFINNLPGSRVFQISLTEETAQTRLWTWGSALKGWKERPILGWGPENFSVVFDKYFDTRHFSPDKKSETWFDRAHSIYFDYLTETGILGYLSFVGIFVVLYVLILRRRKTIERTDSKLKINKEIISFQNLSLGQKSLIFAIPFAYLVQGIVLFDILPTYLNLFLFLAFANFHFTNVIKQND
ncbi:MAG: O-antigen ligase family protein [Patescibacteria group bacterium]|nr:O-antigen ligase family protein [Patescibacteria group bacterium]